MEGAINLMNKVGESFETTIKSTTSKKKDTIQADFDRIINRFTFAMDKAPTDVISTRIKLLIKNMFKNKDDGWSKTKEKNEKGPKTKQEI